jgi:aminoglycoside/choline kinase family phosphotransferase
MWRRSLRSDRPPVILTGEYIPENFLLSRDGGGWHLAGLIDFGDVMTGGPNTTCWVRAPS